MKAFVLAGTALTASLVAALPTKNNYGMGEISAAPRRLQGLQAQYFFLTERVRRLSDQVLSVGKDKRAGADIMVQDICGGTVVMTGRMIESFFS
jgi:hypothetical protein